MKNKLKIYSEYFKYVMEHRRNAFKACWKKSRYHKHLRMHALTHDLSKFRPSEFFPYAEWFYGEYGTKMNKELLSINYAKEKHEKCKEKFDKAWEKHYKRNKHHWNYWVGTIMPNKYILQMICDWEGMSIKFGGTAQEFYMKNHDRLDLHLETRLNLEFLLGLICEEALCSGITWREYCEKSGRTMEQDLRLMGYIK